MPIHFQFSIFNYLYMKHVGIFCILLLVSMGTFGQSANVDSLVNILETQNLSAEKKLDLYKDISQKYMQNDLEKFKKYTALGLELAVKERNKKMQAAFNANTGVFYSYKASYDTALVYMEKALELAKETKNENLEAKLYVNMALNYSMKGDFSKEIEYDLKALPIFEKIGDDKSFITLLVNLGTTYRSLYDEERALYYIDRANKLAEETGYSHGKILVYYAYAGIYYNQKEFEKALEYYLKSIEICKKENNKHFEILCAQSIATVYLEYLKDYRKAEEYANESLQQAIEFGDPFRIRGSLRILAQIRLIQKRYKDCENLATEAWEIDSTDIDTSPDLASMIAISNIHLNNKEKAEHFFHMYIDLNGEKSKKSLQETLIGMEVKYETEKKEMKIASLEKEKQLYIWLGITGILLAIALGVVLRQKMKSIRKEKQLIATRSVLDGEMGERTRLARDLHDRLSGNLSAVKIGLNNQTESLQNVCNKLDSCIEEIRRVAHNLMPASLQFGMKVALEDFAAQFPNVHFHFFGEEHRIEERKEFVIYCCANELVNNSLRHSGAKNINLQLVQDEKHVTLTVQDDGSGFNEKSVAQGIGLKNIRDRVSSCDGKIDIVTSPGKGTETIIEIK